MTAASPSPFEDRWYELSTRLGKSVGPAAFADRLGGWRRARLPTRCALFLAGLVAAGLAYSVLDILQVPHGMACAGVFGLALAEWLIRRHRLFASGIEEALVIAGLLALGFDLFDNGGDISVTRIIAGTFAIAVLRLRNALFATIAALAGVATVVYETGTHTQWLIQHQDRIASLLYYVTALAAPAAGARTYIRPAHDRMLDWLVIALPVAGYVCSAISPTNYFTADYRHDHSPYALYVPLAPLVYGALALYTGLRRRTHAPVLAGMLCVACTAYELRNLTGLPYEVRFMLWGAQLLVVAIVLERWLRQPRRGITSRTLGAHGETTDLLQLAGAAVLAPQAAAAPTASFKGDGGGFGGGGASGHY